MDSDLKKRLYDYITCNYLAFEIPKSRMHTPSIEEVKQKYIENNKPFECSYFATNVLKERWPEAEHIITREPNATIHYAKHLVNEVWPEGEEAVLKDAQCTYFYAVNVLKGPWPADKEERAIHVMQDIIDSPGHPMNGVGNPQWYLDYRKFLKKIEEKKNLKKNSSSESL